VRDLQEQLQAAYIRVERLSHDVHNLKRVIE